MGPPFNVFRFPAADPEQFFLDGVGNGDDLPVGRAVANYEMIRHIAEALEGVGDVPPWGVDVATGVEAAECRKDPEKLKRFIDAVREAQGG